MTYLERERIMDMVVALKGVSVYFEEINGKDAACIGLDEEWEKDYIFYDVKSVKEFLHKKRNVIFK